MLKADGVALSSLEKLSALACLSSLSYLRRLATCGVSIFRPASLVASLTSLSLALKRTLLIVSLPRRLVISTSKLKGVGNFYD